MKTRQKKPLRAKGSGREGTTLVAPWPRFEELVKMFEEMGYTSQEARRRAADWSRTPNVNDLYMSA